MLHIPVTYVCSYVCTAVSFSCWNILQNNFIATFTYQSGTKQQGVQYQAVEISETIHTYIIYTASMLHA